MTLHVNIGEAKTRLSELVAAAVRGEDVVLDKAGTPQVRLVPMGQIAADDRETRGARRRAAIGMFKHLVGDIDIDVKRIKAEDAEYQAALRRKYGDPD